MPWGGGEGRGGAAAATHVHHPGVLLLEVHVRGLPSLRRPRHHLLPRVVGPVVHLEPILQRVSARRHPRQRPARAPAARAFARFRSSRGWSMWATRPHPARGTSQGGPGGAGRGRAGGPQVSQSSGRGPRRALFPPFAAPARPPRIVLEEDAAPERESRGRGRAGGGAGRGGGEGRRGSLFGAEGDVGGLLEDPVAPRQQRLLRRRVVVHPFPPLGRSSSSPSLVWGRGSSGRVR